VEHRDWKKALFDVMPQRKFEVVSKKARRGQKKMQDDEENEYDGDNAEVDEETPAMDESSDATNPPVNVGDHSKVHA
jgi:hypothetical protein